MRPMATSPLFTASSTSPLDSKLVSAPLAIIASSHWRAASSPWLTRNPVTKAWKPALLGTMATRPS